MSKNVFSSTLKRFVFYITIIVLLFSSIIIFQIRYSVLYNQKKSAENLNLSVKNELENRTTSLYSNLTSNALNAQAYLYDSLERLAKLSGTMIWVFDKDGRVLSYAPRIESLKDDLDRRGSYSTYYLPETIDYISLFYSDKDYYGNTKVLKPLLEEQVQISRSYVFLDEYNISRIDSDQTKPIAICICIYKDIEQENIFSNIILLILPILIFIALSISLIAIFAKSVSRPLNEFLGLARSVSQGNLKVRISYTDEKTEIGKLSKTFNSMMDKLEQTEKQRADFTSDVAHELRTPMTSIGGFIEGILDGTIPKEKHDIYLTRVSSEIKRLTNMVKDLLILSKMDADDAALEKSVFDINDLIRRSIISFESAIKRKNIFINVNFAEKNTFVYANSDDIKRVLINLIHNSIKFSNEAGNVTITVEAIKNKVYVYIKDSGVGIDQEDLENIWTRFYKSDKSRGKDKSGTGLGLSIVFSVIKRHNETIDVKSQKGMGTEFVFTLDNAEQIENS